MKKSFNLQKYFKKAFYEDVRGYWSVGSRAWPNCLKCQMDKKNKSKQEAYSACIESYNKDRSKFLLDYAENYPDAINIRVDHASPGTKGLQVQQK